MDTGETGRGVSGGETAVSEITALLAAVETGQPGATDRLFGVVYDELRRLARRQIAHGPGSPTLDTTALVHEAYLKLSHDARWTVENRRHFFNLAARAMRQVLVDHARRRSRQKRGGGAPVVDLDSHPVAAPERAGELLALDEALQRLSAAEPALARLVELRYFSGLSVEQIAELDGVSDRTIKRRWRVARAFLFQELSAPGAAL
ncbi:MAG: sigma-70 family RNA polymerase sigma factor [Thermoanaerobaculia bacterium]